ncbi:hypothetical protein [Psychromicrobium sp. YIM B11713]|uniref:hypothetical protein n=1 Tax=Psychromicrobium sp. YIM B11713 TaxID=3145233 RepID=UPI00374E563E
MSEQATPETQKLELSELQPLSADHDFVPRPRYRPSRSTKVLAAVLIFVLGLGLGGIVVHSVDSANRSGRPQISGNFGGNRNAPENSSSDLGGGRSARPGG